MAALKETTREKLKGVSVATLFTALFKRGLRQQCIQDVHPLNPEGGNMVGEAFTLRYIPAREDLNPITVFQGSQLQRQLPRHRSRETRDGAWRRDRSRKGMGPTTRPRRPDTSRAGAR